LKNREYYYQAKHITIQGNVDRSGGKNLIKGKGRKLGNIEVEIVSLIKELENQLHS